MRELFTAVLVPLHKNETQSLEMWAEGESEGKRLREMFSLSATATSYYFPSIFSGSKLQMAAQKKEREGNKCTK